MLKTIFAGSISGAIRLVVFSAILCSFLHKAHAQSAVFTSDLVLNRNCGADIVDFTITDETGITTVKWEFGNGEPNLDDTFTPNGTGVDASSTYITAGTYTITLTINEGEPSEDIQTLDIDIFDAPEPVFEVTDGSNEGCLAPGLEVNFDYTSDPTDIVQWSYNFGDGTTTVYTAAGGSDGDVSHTYTTHGIYNVFLEVTDINGCVSSFFEPQYVTAYSTPTAAMTVGTPASCDLPIDVTFTDNSTVANTTNPDNNIAFRTWTFVKDPTGTEDTVAQSSDQNPTITFEEFATYRAILIVATSPGLCADTITQDFTLVQNTVDFLPTSPTTSCVNEAINFQDNSTDGSGAPSAYLWDFGDGNTSTDQDPSYAYTTGGTFDVSLTVTFADGCQKTLEKEGLIVINPDLNAAIAVDAEESCEPYTANFTATPSTGIQYQWDFEYDGMTPSFDVTSTANTASHDYTSAGTYSVLLRTTSSDGCVEDVVESNLIMVASPDPDFSVPAMEREGCVGTLANFDASATTNSLPMGNAGIASYNWDFDNDGTEDQTGLASATTSYNYPTEGSFTVTLRVVTDAGCEFSITKNDYVVRGLEPTASFNFSQADQCIDTSVSFTSTSIPNGSSLLPIDSVIWDFGDGTVLSGDYMSLMTPSHTYIDDTEDDGTSYTVSLTVFSNGCESTVYTDQVDIDYPVARFNVTSNDFSCLDQGATTIDFDAIDGATLSEGVTEYRWDFGDGTLEPGPLATDFTTGSDPTTSHTYSTSGDFTATLYVRNANGCEDSFDATINVSNGGVDFSADMVDICHSSDDVTFTNLSTSNTSGGVTYAWDFGTDADPATSNVANPPTVRYNSPGFKTVTLTQTEANGCVRVVTKSNYIEAEGPLADFNFSSTNADNTIQCLEPAQSMSFTNNSTANGTGNTNVSYAWDFGDGASPATSTDENPGTVTYSTTGQKTITLTVTDNEGCSHTKQQTEFIQVPNPVAAFNTDDTEYCTGDNVVITNTSTENVLTSITAWSWDFGSGATPATSTAEDPGSVSYSTIGTKTISLTVTTSGGCTNTVTSDINVYEANASFSVAEVNMGCAPQVAEFTDTSVDVVAWEWDFGDQFGSTSNLQNPNHLYFYPGVYDVRLTTTSAGGCQETSTVQTVTVDGPYYTTFSHGTSGCLDNDNTNNDGITLTFTITGLVETAEAQLDWGDGEPSYIQMNGNNISETHTYTRVGTFTPKLTLEHTGSCGSYIYVSDQKVIISQDPKPTFTSEAISGDGCQDTQILFEDQTQLEGGILDSRYPITGWLWDFGDNDNTTSTNKNATFTYDDEIGDVTVELTTTTEFGCSAMVDSVIHIEPGIIDLTSATDETVCSGTTPSTLDGDDSPTQGDGMNYDFLWETSTNQTDWADAPGTNDQADYSPAATTPSVQTTVYYRRITTSGPCEFISGTFSITTDAATNGGTLSSDATECFDDNSGTLILSDEVGDVLKWQYSTDNFMGDINDIANTTNTEDYSDLTVTTYYRAQTKNGVCGTEFSNVVTITVLPEITGNVLATELDACEGVDPGTITATAAGGGEGNFTYQWQSSSNNSNWSDIGGETGASYDPGVVPNDIYVRRRVTSNGNCVVFSNSLFIQVSPAADASNDQTISGATTSLAADASGFVGTDAGMWRFTAKPTGVPDPIIDTPSSPTTSISGLEPGTYTFEWEVDNGTCSTTDDMTITVQPTIQIAVSPASVDEDGGTNLVYTFTSNGAIDAPLTINFDVSGATTDGDDYTDTGAASYSNTSGTITLPATQTSVSINITPVDDTDIEQDEDLTLTITSGTGYVIGTNDEATGTIADDDDDNVVMVLTKRRDGDEENTVSVQYRVTLHDGSAAGDVLSNRTGSNFGFRINYSAGTATTSDVQLGSQNSSVNNNNSFRNRTRNVTDDLLIEVTETISAQLANPTAPVGVTISVDPTSVPANILDNDSEDATLLVETIQNGVEGGNDVQFRVRLTDGGSNDLTNATGAPFTGTIGFSGPATLADFTESAFPTTFSIADGDISQDFTFDPINDATVEFETITATISSPVANNGITPAIGTASDQATIDDDAELEIAFTQDGTEDAANVQYTVKLTSAGIDNTNATGADITADIDFTGVATADFAITLPTEVTIGNGAGSTLVDLDVFDDLLVEGDETVNAALSNPTVGVTISATLDDADAQIIDNDDGAVTLIEITNEQDGSEDGTNVQFRVNLVDGASQDLTNQTGSDISATIMFSNEAGQADFTTTFPTTVTIPDGSGFIIVDLVVNDDLLIEEDEIITATISSPVGASLAAASSADATVADNDDDNVHIKIITVQDGVEGGDNVQFDVILTDTNDGSGNTLTNATASGFTTNIGFTGATQADFSTTFPTTVTIPDGQSTTRIDLDAITDTSVEIETLTGTISGASHSTVPVSIAVNNDVADIDDDAVLVIEATQNGDETGPVNIQYTVTVGDGAGTPYTNDSGSPITATVAFTGDAEASDITGGLGNTSISIPADGSSTDVITRPVIDDALVEDAETITATLSAPSTGVTISGADGADDASLADNDVANVTINNGINTEGDDITFDIAMSAPVEGAVVIDIDFTNGTAEAGDYTGASQQVTFPDGNNTTRQITVPTIEDVMLEEDETFTATVSRNSGNTKVTASDTGIGTITDDDAATVTIGDAVNDEGEDLVFDVDITNPVEGDVVIDVTFTNGTAGSADYATATQQVTFSSGTTTTQQVTVASAEDGTLEADENFTATVSRSSGNSEVVATDTGTGTITDDDGASVTISDAIITEGGDLSFELELTNDVQGDVQVVVSFGGGDAEAGDYDNSSQTFTFTGGTAGTRTVTVGTTNDTVLEDDETFTASLALGVGNVNGEVVVTDTGTGTITDNDAAAVTIDDIAVGEGGDLDFTLTLDNNVEGDVVIDVSFGGGTAEADDYEEATQTFTFTGGTPGTHTVTVGTTDDNVFEIDETFNVSLSLNAGNGDVDTSDGGLGTITDDDPITITINDDTEAEGDALEFTVTLSNPSDTDIDIPYTTNDGTATTGDSDYTDNDNTLTITAGATTGTITVNTTEDVVFEGDETLTVDLTSSTQGTITDAQGAGSITDDDPITITINDDTEAEGDALEFTVTLSNPSDTDIDIPYTTNDGTATTGDSDYTDNDNTLTITAGGTTGTITVNTTEDLVFEGDETLTVDLTSSTQGTITDAQGDGTITDDDPITITINDDTEAEGDALEFTVTLSNPSDTDIDIPYTTNDGTATTGDSDYTDNDNTLTITAGGTTGTITVNTTEDLVFEGDETLTVDLTSSTQGTITDAQGDGTITDDDPITITINDDTEAEGDALEFTVTLSNPSDTDIDIPYTTNDGTATTGDSDYTDNDNTLTITAGATTGTITVNTTEDLVFEGDETLTVDLTSSTQGTITDAQGDGTITDDDPITITINDDTEAEGDALEFTVTLSNPSDTDIDIPYTTNDGTATTGDSDYTDNDNTLTITAGATTGTITVNTTEDLVFEGDETLTVDLTSSTQGTITDAQGDGTITDDDPITITINDDTEAEGDALEFTVTLSNPSDTDIDIPYTTNDGTATTGDSDYTDNDNTLTITAGATTGTITVNTTEDVVFEGDETLTVDLTSSTQGTITDAQGAGSITDDDPITITINDDTEAEGDALEFTVTLSNPSDTDIDIPYTTNDGTATTGDSDYTDNDNTLTITAGGTTGTITVNTTEDLVFEGDETLTVDLTSSTQGTITDAQGDGTITDDDPITITINDDTEAEGDALEFTVTLSNPSDTDIDIPYTTNDGTATTGDSDYTDNDNTLTITAGGTTGTITVNTTEDLVFEGDETLTVDLTSSTQGTITDAQGDGTITDDDPITITINDDTEAEGDALEFTVTLSNPSDTDIDIPYTTNDGTATTGDSDYTDNDNTLTITAGATTGTITVNTTEDLVFEGDETLTVDLTSSTQGTITDAQGDGTITDDDPITITINDDTEAEGDALEFTVTLSNPSDTDIDIPYTTNDGTATTGDSDYTDNDNTLTITAGATTGTITVNTTEDLVFEGDETLTVDLTSSTQGTITDAQGDGTITDDDPITITINDDTEAEGDALEFTVTLSNPSDTDIDIPYTTNDGTATTGDSDYTDNDNTLTITAGGTTGTITVNTTEDLVFEGDETLTVDLTSSTQGTITDAQGDGTITDDDPITITINDDTEAEGDALEFTVTLSNPSDTDIDIPYTTNDGTATTGDSDYTDNDNTLTITAGGTTGTITVNTTEDLVFEGDETLTVDLTSSTQGTITDAQGDGTITDDDPITITINDDTEAEGDALEFTVTLSNPSDTDIDIPYTTNDGTATTGDSDYTDNDNTLTITAGGTTGMITVATVEDATLEFDEDLTVTLVSTSQGTIVDNQGEGDIIDDDVAQVTINDGMATEGNDISLDVTLDADVDGAVVVDVTFTNVETENDDYVETTQTVTFPTGAAGTQTITLGTTDDMLLEIDETFTASLSLGTGNANFEVVVTDTGTGTIVDGDAAEVTISDGSATEGSAISFDLTLNADVDGDVVVDVTFTNVETENDDYVETIQTVTFSGGTAGTQTITVGTTDDNLLEIDETFTASLSLGAGNVSSEVVVTDTGTGTIIDGDMAEVTISDGSATEGGDISLTVSLSTPVDGGATIDISFTDVSASGSGVDYTSTTQQVTFADGDNTDQTITIATQSDDLIETDETFTAGLSLNAGNSEIVATDTGTGTILDADDDDPQWVIVKTQDGTEDGVDVIYTVALVDGSSNALTNVTGGQLTTNIAFIAGSTAVQADLNTTFPTVVTMPNGEDSVRVSLVVAEDDLVEGNEQLTATISGPSLGSISIASADAIIDDDDDGANLWVITRTQDGKEGGDDVIFTVGMQDADGNRLRNIFGMDLTANIAFADGSEAIQADFSTTYPTTVTIADGDETTTVTLEVANDSLLENVEAIVATISNPSLGAIGTAQATATVDDEDDDDPLWVIEKTQDGNETGVDVMYRVSLQDADGSAIVNVSGSSVTANIAFSEGSVATQADLTTTFPALASIGDGDSTTQITLVAASDNLVEGSEDLVATISSPSVGSVSVPRDTATIADEDADNTVWRISTVQNGFEGVRDVIYQVAIEDRTGNALINGTGADLTTSIAFVEGSTALQEDFSTTYPTTIGIPADTSAMRFNLATILDEPVEEVEIIRATISGPQYGFIGTATADATIDDNSNNPPVAVTDSASTQEDIAIIIDVLDNDSDPDDDDLTITTAGFGGTEDITQNGGAVSINDNGTPTDPTDDFIDYTPPSGFAGFDSFTYTISDGDETATATVVVGVDMNNPPIAVNDTTSVPGSGSLEIEALINDSDPDGDDIVINFIESSSGVTVSTDGTIISYAPPLDYCGVDTVTYQICDYGPLCDRAVVLITVIPDDTDGDGIFDFLETTILDSDDDGTPNYQDLDSDNDGIPDSEEVEFIDDCTIEFPDSDNDGEEDYTDADIVVYDSFTPDGDGINDNWVIEDIESFPNNTVRLFNRWGNLIYEETGYNNTTRSWDASRTNGVGFGSDRVPDGTYFYVIDLGDGSRARSGYVVIKR